jgi:hypothetical protein
MRKLRLLLYAGAMASAVAGTAFAYEFAPSDGSTPAGPLQNAAGVGMPSNASGFQELGSPYSAGQGQQYAPGASGVGTSPFSTPAPGTVVVRINLQAVAGFQVGTWTGINGQGTGVASSPIIGNKEQPYGVVGFWRFDFAVDGMSKTGVRYGAFTEIRQNAPGGQTTSSTSSGGAAAAMTSANASALSSGTSADDSANTLYLRNMCAYVGSDTLGIIRIGQGSCVDPASAVLTGLNDEFDYGGWDGAVTITPGAVTPAWPWPDSGSDYMPQGMAYLSPVLAGFDFVVGFSPNNSTIITNTSCNGSFQGCANQEASNVIGDYARWNNRFEVSLRYRNAFGPVGFAVAGTYTHSGVVQPGPTAPTTGSGGVRFNPLNYGTIGAEVSVNRWFAVGANTMFGAFNGPGVLQAKPYAAQTSSTTAIAWEAGAKYTIPTIPLTFGGSYYNFKYQGQPGLPTQRVSQGIDVGAVYGLGPGMVVFLEGLWGQITQGGFNFISGSCSVSAVCSSTAGAGASNNVQVRIAMTGLALQF